MSLPLSFFPSVEAAQLRAFLSSPLSFFLSFFLFLWRGRRTTTSGVLSSAWSRLSRDEHHAQLNFAATASTADYYYSKVYKSVVDTHLFLVKQKRFREAASTLQYLIVKYQVKSIFHFRTNLIQKKFNLKLFQLSLTVSNVIILPLLHLSVECIFLPSMY